MNIAECVRSYRRGRPMRGLSKSDKARLAKLADKHSDLSSHGVARAYAAPASKKAAPKPAFNEDMTVKELYALAKSLGISGVSSRTKKAGLLKALEG